MNSASVFWVLSFLFALMIHACLLMGFLFQTNQGALAEGKHGIELDLGMLGDSGEHTETVNQARANNQPIAPIETLATSTPVEEVRQLDTPFQETIPEALQETDLVAPLVTAETDIADQTSEMNDQSAPDETILVDQSVSANREQNEPLVNKELLMADQMKSQKSLMKQTTGEAQAIQTGGSQGVDANYLAILVAQLAEHKRYPFSSRQKAEEGIAVLDFEISRTGKVMLANIQKSSGFPALDKAVLSMLKRAEPFPPVPPDIKGEPIRLTLPIAFKLNG